MIAILSFVYFATVREIESQLQHRINNQINQLATTYNARGMEEMKKQMLEFVEEDDEGLFIYLVVDAKGKPIIGNMENWPEDVEYSEKWLMFDIDAKNEEKISHILAMDKLLPNEYHLLLGYSLKSAEHTRKIMFDVICASIALAFAVTIFGGTLLSGLIRRKLEAVNTICNQVIDGNLHITVPLTGGIDEFETLAKNVNSMLARIAELVKGLKQTSDNIAHDLRTRLNRHRIRLETLMNQPAELPRIQEHIKAAMEELDMIVETLNSILRISQAQSGIASGHFIQFDLSVALIDVVEFYEELAEQKHITLYLDIAENIMVTGDKPMLTQAIANLLDNAIKYTPKHGHVTITLKQNEGFVECIIADNGSGIPPELYEKVKERFFRLEKSRTSAGTGLGLSLVDAVARLHRGELLFADNHTGLIATLTIKLLE